MKEKRIGRECGEAMMKNRIFCVGEWFLLSEEGMKYQL